MMALSVLFSRVQRVDELSETLPRNLDADTEENEGGEYPVSHSKAHRSK